MVSSRIFVPLLLWTLLLQCSNCQDKIPDNNEFVGASKPEARSERQEILSYLLDLKSSFAALAGSIQALNTRVRNIEDIVKDSEARTTKQIDEFERRFQELSGNVTTQLAAVEIIESRNSEQMRLNSAPIPNPAIALSNETREELTNNTNRVQEGVVSSFQDSQIVAEYKLGTTNSPIESTTVELTNEEINARKELLLKDPKAIFFTGENMTGEVINYDSTNATYQGGGCSDLEKAIKSMKITETCVRVFQYEFCQGPSRPIYPKPNSGPFINFLSPEELPFVRSVGPCLPNEFQFANESLDECKMISVTKDDLNPRQVPDSLAIGGVTTYDPNPSIVKLDVEDNPVKGYLLEEGRPKWLEASIEDMHIKNDNANKSDVPVGMGMAIPAEFGGPTNESYNMFPQSQRNFENWKRITDLIHPFFRDEGSMKRCTVYMTFAYDEDFSLREPYGFYYWVGFRVIPFDYDQIMYGFLEN